MLTTVQAVVEDNQIKLLESVPLYSGQLLLVTFLSEAETEFWALASESSLDAIWGNEEDDVYAQLLQR